MSREVVEFKTLFCCHWLCLKQRKYDVIADCPGMSEDSRARIAKAVCRLKLDHLSVLPAQTNRGSD